MDRFSCTQAGAMYADKNGKFMLVEDCEGVKWSLEKYNEDAIVTHRLLREECARTAIAEARIKVLEGLVNRIKIDGSSAELLRLVRELETAEVRIKVLEDALQFYAKACESAHVTALMTDGGQTARQALSQDK